MSVALVIQQTMRVHGILIICGLSKSTIFFARYLKNTRFSEKKVTENEICISIFSTNLSAKVLILGRIERGIIINDHRSLRKVPVIPLRF